MYSEDMEIICVGMQSDVVAEVMREATVQICDASQLIEAIDSVGDCPVGILAFGAAAADALVAATEREIGAIVACGGRPDLAMPVLAEVKAPTLLIVGGRDLTVLEMNERAIPHLGGKKRLDLIPRATHQFEEPGALEKVAKLARRWFLDYLG